MACRRFLVSGLVQGVGFRAFVVRAARRLGVTGKVWNRADGRVELIAFHMSVGVLDALEAELSNGPGHVDSIAAFEEAPDEAFEGFKIGGNG